MPVRRMAHALATILAVAGLPLVGTVTVAAPPPSPPVSQPSSSGGGGGGGGGGAPSSWFVGGLGLFGLIRLLENAKRSRALR